MGIIEVSIYLPPILERLKQRLAGSKLATQRHFVARGETPVIRAVEWLHANENPNGGIFLSSGDALSYPEVTGYLIPTLLSYGEQEFAVRLTRWLIGVQRKDGSFTSADGHPHVFDTGQALRGLLAAFKFMPEAFEAGRRTAEYLHSRMKNRGLNGFEIDPIWVRRYSKSIPFSSHLYLLPPMLKAAALFQNAEWKSEVENSIDYYVNSPESLRPSTLTHFLAYELEALIDLGKINIALPLLTRFSQTQSEDGSVLGKPNVTWVCTPGLAQLAVCWYKTGQPEPADRAMNWLAGHQTQSGGFRGSYGENADYFQNVEICWAVKFYLDAALLSDGRVSTTAMKQRNGI
jgi:malonyl-CoA O-methyltransferase